MILEAIFQAADYVHEPPTPWSSMTAPASPPPSGAGRARYGANSSMVANGDASTPRLHYTGNTA